MIPKTGNVQEISSETVGGKVQFHSQKGGKVQPNQQIMMKKSTISIIQF